MRIKKYCITPILLLFGVGVAHSQERHTEICIDFRVNSTVIDSAYSDNAVRMQEMVEFLGQCRPYAGDGGVPTNYPTRQYNQYH